METPTVIRCDSCGSEITPHAAFCSVCGAKVTHSATPPHALTRSSYFAVFKENISKLFKGRSIPIFIRNSFLILISLALLLFILAPVVTIKTEINNRDVRIRAVSPIEATILGCSSFLSLDEFDLLDTKAYDKCENLIEKYQKLQEQIKDDSENNDEDMINEDMVKLSEKILYYSTKLSLMSEDVSVTPAPIPVVVFSVLYILGSLLFFAAAIWNMVAFLRHKFAPYRLTVSLFLAVPLLRLLTVLAIRSSGILELYSMFDGDKLTYASAGNVWLYILCGVTVLVLMFYRRYTEGKRAGVLLGASRILACTFLILAISMLAAPVLRSEITAKFIPSDDFDIDDYEPRNSTVVLHSDIEFFHNLYLDEKEKDEFNKYDLKTADEETFEWYDEFPDYTRRELKKGQGDWLNALFMIHAYCAYDGADTAIIFSFYPIVALLAAAALALLAWRTLKLLCIGGSDTLLGISAKLAALLLLVALIVLAIVFSSIVNFNLNFEGINYSLSIARGPILMTVFFALSAFLPTKDRVTAYVPITNQTVTAATELKADAPIENLAPCKSAESEDEETSTVL